MWSPARSPDTLMQEYLRFRVQGRDDAEALERHVEKWEQAVVIVDAIIKAVLQAADDVNTNFAAGD